MPEMPEVQAATGFYIPHGLAIDNTGQHIYIANYFNMSAVADEATPLERAMIVYALRKHGGNLAAAAARIGWTRQKLYRRMGALGIDRWAP